jgi:hypothetical protein
MIVKIAKQRIDYPQWIKTKSFKTEVYISTNGLMLS